MERVEVFHKCALLMACWPAIAEETQKKRRKPRFWRIPSSFAVDAKLTHVSVQDPRALKITRQKAGKKKVAKARKDRRDKELPAQGALPLKGGKGERPRVS